ncbi:MAG: hypothetical protein HUJ61_00895 [Bacilli bacterium]|nr:hypothetical protein [Bacilli bacterium]
MHNLKKTIFAFLSMLITFCTIAGAQYDSVKIFPIRDIYISENNTDYQSTLDEFSNGKFTQDDNIVLFEGSK